MILSSGTMFRLIFYFVPKIFFIIFYLPTDNQKYVEVMCRNNQSTNDMTGNGNLRSYHWSTDYFDQSHSLPRTESDAQFTASIQPL